MAIKKGDMVKFHYSGSFEDGEEFGSTRGKMPLEFKIGEGAIIQGVEEALMGMEKSEKKEIVVSPEKGFGKRDENLVKKVPKNVAGAERVVIGQTISMKNKEGHVFNGKVKSIESDTITIDLNHPLAGRTLKVKLEVVDIK